MDNFPLVNFADFDSDAFQADMNKRIAEANAERALIEQGYEARRVKPEQVGSVNGPVHAASILIWGKIAELSNVPFIPVERIASLSMKTVRLLNEPDGDKSISPEQQAEIQKAEFYANLGGYWRTDICAGEEVKYRMGSGQDLPDILPFHMNDLRIYEMHWGIPFIDIIGRPKLTPVRHKGYPVEFRVFHGCQAEEDGAVSWYYPQTGKLEPTPELEAWMTEAAQRGTILHQARERLGLVPWIPGQVGPSHEIGSTIDFMVTHEMGLVMVDAGPGYGAGAHPCCGIDRPIKGRMWSLAPGVELR